MAFTPFKIEDLYNRYEGRYQHNLSSACMPALSLAELMELYEQEEQEEIFSELLKLKLDYSTQFGANDIREALVENLYTKLDTKNFLVCSGASEGIFLAMNSLFLKGDKIVVQKPVYQSLHQISEDNGVEIIDWHVKENNWDIDELEKLIKKKPEIKGLVINNPNNPTGTAFNEKELHRILNVLDGRYLISDEVFQPLSLQNTPSASEIYDKAISICDLSKSFSLPGLRLGWLACQDDILLARLSQQKNYISLRNSTISEFLAPLVIDVAKDILDLNKTILKENIAKLYQNKDKLFFKLDLDKKDIAGLCIFPEMNTDFDTDALIKEKNTLLAGGINFDEKYSNRCRIGLGNLELEKILELA